MRAMSDDYVLGTHDDEIARLELQHDVWRSAALAAWERAGIAPGHTVIDLGCGPGFAAADLASVVGPAGRVHALDKSQRFLELTAARAPQIATHEIDLDADELAIEGADAAWARWVFCFLAKPRALLERVARALAPGGRFVAHEYFDYGAWRSSPRVPEIEEFVAAVMASWRAGGGEPDIALDLVPWVCDLGFEIASVRPIVDVVAPGTPKWRWVHTFGNIGLDRLVELGRVTHDRAAAIRASWATLSARRDVHMVTPAVLEIVAIRR
jgi:SAM-dependent methyltransferase